MKAVLTLISLSHAELRPCMSATAELIIPTNAEMCTQQLYLFYLCASIGHKHLDYSLRSSRGEQFAGKVNGEMSDSVFFQLK